MKSILLRVWLPAAIITALQFQDFGFWALLTAPIGVLAVVAIVAASGAVWYGRPVRGEVSTKLLACVMPWRFQVCECCGRLKCKA